MSSSCVKTIGGAGLRCDGIKGTLLPTAVGQFMAVHAGGTHTCALCGSCRVWNKISMQAGHCTLGPGWLDCTGAGQWDIRIR